MNSVNPITEPATFVKLKGGVTDNTVHMFRKGDTGTCIYTRTVVVAIAFGNYVLTNEVTSLGVFYVCLSISINYSKLLHVLKSVQIEYVLIYQQK